MSAPGLVIAAPSSGSGKTIVALGLAAAWRAAGRTVAAAKAGPDYIDTAFFSAVADRPAVNLDPWGMREATLLGVAADAAAGADLLLVEGVMGLFDGAAGGVGSTADLARRLCLPVVLVVDASHQAQSVAALAHGFRTFDPSLDMPGVILNRVASARHERLLQEALAGADILVLGAIPREKRLALPSRHLGLVQATETPDLPRLVDDAASLVAAHVDLDRLAAAARPLVSPTQETSQPSPPGPRIALARDAAFAFTYQHLLAAWHTAGSEIVPFSPLADESPDAAADMILLPGGYPELHAGKLAANARFLDGLREAAERGVTIHGECGGYMVLGRGLTDAQGVRHAMAGLLGLETSFTAPRLTLGYRRATALAPSALLPTRAHARGHEFHYAAILEETGEPLFRISDSEGSDLGPAGLVSGRVSGSFIHMIDRE